MLLTNFLLSKAKRELSPQLYRLPKGKTGAINQAVKNVIKDIDSILLKCEGETTKEFLTKRKYQALETVLSYLVQEGFSQMRQKQISRKSGISIPLINFILNWLEDLEVCHQIKTRYHGKIAPSIYILSLHNNYLKIVEYFKQKWAYTINVFSRFTEFLSKKINKKQNTDVNRYEDTPVSTCHGFDLFTPLEETVEVEAEEQENEEQETNSDEDKKLELRFKEMNDHMSDAQQKLYMYILTQETTITEKDAYTIALRMPADVDWEVKKTFEECVRWFGRNQADVSAPAHFMKMYTKKLRAYREIRMEKYKKDRESRVDIDFKKFKEMLDPNS
ncbi:Replicase RepFR55 [Bacillus pseudomycoides]|uniref:Replicase RepFR55 n=1 Tax=Bacillus pseudomycoides TaxID=64104 RepID=UPI000BFE006A|nr:Replicase RepFR55 [Bacillus pseudomycoides]PGE04276.1 Replicase RepFR55 [Bacillus pseudomycoides]PHG20755.1 Replicase RepFR55 [Bacillus pseudomycoides]